MNPLSLHQIAKIKQIMRSVAKQEKPLRRSFFSVRFSCFHQVSTSFFSLSQSDEICRSALTLEAPLTFSCTSLSFLWPIIYSAVPSSLSSCVMWFLRVPTTHLSKFPKTIV
ncbi:hypothetical protein CDAR_544381 [Caerostris darwini]|uniref:Uncharacterized protein n=1 Tax=Caerostris darwini TaxID=1538125 RepID=A0AAV4R9A0_9ARAC|nr:hypothetical protein CDAR_544381 [Caerostris darwini]